MMKSFGAILMILGVLGAIISFSLHTYVSTTGTFIGREYVGGGSTVTLSLLQPQMMLLRTSLTCSSAGRSFSAPVQSWKAALGLPQVT